MRTRGTQYVPQERDWPVVGYCGVCGVAINEACFRGGEHDARGIVAGEWYTCGVCGGRWQA